MPPEGDRREVEPRASPLLLCWALLLCCDWRASPVFFWHRASPFIPTSASLRRKISEHTSQFSEWHWFRIILSLVSFRCCFRPSRLGRWFRFILSLFVVRCQVLLFVGHPFGCGFVLSHFWLSLGVAFCRTSFWLWFLVNYALKRENTFS